MLDDLQKESGALTPPPPGRHTLPVFDKIHMGVHQVNIPKGTFLRLRGFAYLVCKRPQNSLDNCAV